MECRFESTNDGELNFINVAKYPFTNSGIYEYNTDLFKYGTYLK